VIQRVGRSTRPRLPITADFLVGVGAGTRMWSPTDKPVTASSTPVGRNP